MKLSPWRPPELSMRWWPVFRRNLLVWRKLAVPSLVGNIAEPLIWLVAFGYGMGMLVGQVRVGGAEVPYILFLASGSICMSAMNAASFSKCGMAPVWRTSMCQFALPSTDDLAL